MSDKNSNIYKIIFIITLLIFSIKLVSAADNFRATTGQTPPAICPGSTTLFTDVIENVIDSPLAFTISNTGSSSSFTTTVPTGFILKPGQKKTIYTYVSPRTTTRVGSYTLDVLVSSDGESETLSHRVDVRDCSSFSLVQVNGLKTICPSDIERYEFTLTNNGQLQDTYDLRVEGQIAPWVTLSENQITLASGASKQVFAYISSTQDSLGDYEFTLVAQSKTNARVTSATASLRVNPCFDFKLITERDFLSFCEHSTQSIPIEIVNDGSTQNTYDLEIDGPTWASLENNQIDLAPGQQGEVNLILNPDYGVEGDFKVGFKATTRRGKLTNQNVFDISVQKCHSVAVDLETSQDSICNSLSNTYNVLIKNTGQFEKDFRLEITGPTWSQIDTSRVFLDADEETQVTLTINPGFEVTPGEYDITVGAQALDSSAVIAQDTIKITTVSREECYQPQIGLSKTDIEVFYDSAATVPVVIENKGTYDATYTLDVSGTAANFVHLNPGVITVKPNRAELVYLYIAPSTETKNGDYQATISVRLGDSTILATDDVNIKVSESTVPVEEPIPALEQQAPQRKSFWQRLKEFFTGAPREQPPTEQITPPENISEGVSKEVPVPGENVTETEVIQEEVPVEQVTPPEPNLIDFSQEESKEVIQIKDQETRFLVVDEEHTTTVTNVSEDQVTFTISSDPVSITLRVGESRNLDLNGDDITDVRITLIGFDDAGRPIVRYEALSGAFMQETTPTPQEEVMEENVSEEGPLTQENVSEVMTEEQETIQQGPTQSFFSRYKWYLLAAIVILLIVIIIQTKFYLRIKEFFEEEIEDETDLKKPKKKVEEKPTKKQEAKETKKEEKPKEEKKAENKKEPKKKEPSEEEYY